MGKCLILMLLLQASLFSQTGGPPDAPTTAVTVSAGDADATTLLRVKRIYVESFGDDTASKELQSMVVSSLVATKRFKVTENRERADAILKGTATEKTSQEVHAYGDATNVGSAAGGSHGSVNGSWTNGTGSVSGSSHGGFVARHMGISDSSLNTETINDARVAIRLVTSDGDVIWTTTQESKGAKYKGATADAADKCVKKLLRDVEKLEGAISPGAPAGVPQPDPK